MLVLNIFICYTGEGQVGQTEDKETDPALGCFFFNSPPYIVVPFRNFYPIQSVIPNIDNQPAQERIAGANGRNYNTFYQDSVIQSKGLHIFAEMT